MKGTGFSPYINAAHQHGLQPPREYNHGGQVVLTLFYYDQRIPREGYDVERMMDAAGLNLSASQPAEELPVALSIEEQTA